MTRSKAKTEAQKAIQVAAERAGSPKADAAASIAIAYALLEVAFQLGRIADQVPVWGPPEEG